MGVSKAQLRQRLKTKRQKLSQAKVNELSNLIALRCLQNINWKGVKRLHVYSPIAKWRELDPQPLLSALKSGLPYLEITIQPKTGSQRPRKKFDVVIVPTLGFDERGYRLGMGGGFYDKFLAAQPKALKIGLAYEQGFIEEGVPTEPYDIPLDIIVTEGIIIRHESNSGKNR